MELVWIVNHVSHSPEGQVVGPAVRLLGQQTGPDFPSNSSRAERVE